MAVVSGDEPEVGGDVRELRDRVLVVVVVDPLLAGDEHVRDGKDLASSVERRVGLGGRIAKDRQPTRLHPARSFSAMTSHRFASVLLSTWGRFSLIS